MMKNEFKEMAQTLKKITETNTTWVVTVKGYEKQQENILQIS